MKKYSLGKEIIKLWSTHCYTYTQLGYLIRVEMNNGKSRLFTQHLMLTAEYMFVEWNGR